MIRCLDLLALRGIWDAQTSVFPLFPPSQATGRKRYIPSGMVQDKGACVVLAPGLRIGQLGWGLPPSTLRDLEMRLIDPRHAANRAAIHFLQRGRRRPEPGPTRQHERCMLCVVPSRKRALMFTRIPLSQLPCNRVAALPTRYSIPGSGEGKLPRVQTSKVFWRGWAKWPQGLRHPAGDNALRRSLSASVCSCQR